MTDPGDIFESIRYATEFTVTDDHLRLLRHAHITWDDAEYGAPEIDPKRPYGNSYVARDIGSILGAPPGDWEDGEVGGFVLDEVEQRYARLHAEAAVALQIALNTGAFEAGRYTRADGYAVWRRRDN
jgi:hypothetical protein